MNCEPYYTIEKSNNTTETIAMGQRLKGAKASGAISPANKASKWPA